mmetsp:Transcript_1494/g.9139  ORF Transcript_1494/g.9139 Transcript_1494/m.9139 type:complete len:389 (+) Transcript_1494:150-1316(+)
MGWRRRDPTRGIHGWRNGRKRTRCAWIRHQPRQAQNTQRIERKVQSHRHGKIRPRQIRSSALGLRQIQQAETKPETTGRGPQSMGQSDETARTSMKPPSPSRMERTQIKKKMSHTQDDEVDANRRKREDEKEHEGSCSTRVRPTDCLCLKKKREGKDGKKHRVEILASSRFRTTPSNRPCEEETKPDDVPIMQRWDRSTSLVEDADDEVHGCAWIRGTGRPSSRRSSEIRPTSRNRWSPTRETPSPPVHRRGLRPTDASRGGTRQDRARHSHLDRADETHVPPSSVVPEGPSWLPSRRQTFLSCSWLARGAYASSCWACPSIPVPAVPDGPILLRFHVRRIVLARFRHSSSSVRVLRTPPNRSATLLHLPISRSARTALVPSTARIRP